MDLRAALEWEQIAGDVTIERPSIWARARARRVERQLWGEFGVEGRMYVQVPVEAVLRVARAYGVEDEFAWYFAPRDAM